MVESTMRFFGKEHYHKGFYLLESENISKSIAEIKNPKWDFKDFEDGCDGFSYEDADVFRMGSCQLFSLALSQAMGLPAYELRGENDRFIHAFCTFEYINKKAYVDVRGATTDLTEFLTGLYIDFNEKLLCYPQNTTAEIEKLTPDEKLGYDFALYVMQKNPDFYSAE